MRSKHLATPLKTDKIIFTKVQNYFLTCPYTLNNLNIYEKETLSVGHPYLQVGLF